MKRLLLLAVIFIPGLAQARLGFTIEQCDQLYEKKLGAQDNTHIYQQGELVFLCGFNDPDKGCKDLFVSTIKKLPLTSKEIEKVLEENPGGGEWKVDENSDSRWHHSTGKWQADYIRGELIIQKPVS